MLQSPPLASMLPFHHAMQVAAAQVSEIAIKVITSAFVTNFLI